MKVMSAHRDHVTDLAAYWFVRAQNRDFTKADREEFASWLAGSAEHVLEFLSLSALSEDIRDASANMDVDALVDLARQTDDRDNVVEMSVPATVDIAKPERSSKSWRRPAVLSTAASVLLAIGTGVWLFSTSGPGTYSTGIGEQISFSLEDGSVVTLNAQSSLEVDFTETERNLRLLAGEALFDVEQDANRPFQVRTNRAVIRAAGTAFNVWHRGENTTVTVVEGTVDVESLGFPIEAGTPGPESGELERLRSENSVSAVQATVLNRPIRLSAGQQARIQRQSIAITISSANVENATSWRERRLAFEARPLLEVVNEFNLFSDARFVIKDEELTTVAISGAFEADDPESFALFLSEAGLAVAKTRGDGTVELRRPEENR